MHSRANPHFRKNIYVFKHEYINKRELQNKNFARHTDHGGEFNAPCFIHRNLSDPSTKIKSSLIETKRISYRWQNQCSVFESRSKMEYLLFEISDWIFLFPIVMAGLTPVMSPKASTDRPIGLEVESLSVSCQTVEVSWPPKRTHAISNRHKSRHRTG